MFRKNYWFSFLTAVTLFLFVTAAYLPGSLRKTIPSLASADPLWCPSGVAPTPNANGCTKAYPNLYALINDIVNGIIPQPGLDGTIWIEMGPDNSPSNIILDANALGTWSMTRLTFQGGWDGVSGSTNIIGVSSFTKYIDILDWKNQITVNDLSISGTTDTGLAVSTR